MGNVECQYCQGLHTGECKRPLANRFTKRTENVNPNLTSQQMQQAQQPLISRPSLGNHGSQEVPRESHLNVAYINENKKQIQA
jgi:hypothetical protein